MKIKRLIQVSHCKPIISAVWLSNSRDKCDDSRLTTHDIFASVVKHALTTTVKITWESTRLFRGEIWLESSWSISLCYTFCITTRHLCFLYFLWIYSRPKWTKGVNCYVCHICWHDKCSKLSVYCVHYGTFRYSDVLWCTQNFRLKFQHISYD
jgi:hypothetical protein